MKKVHDTWKLLKPKENEKYENFRFEEYYNRVQNIQKLSHIPKAILEQWIYYHHQEYHTLQNYAWINYENIEFRIEKWSFEKLSKVNVIEDFQDYVNQRSRCTDFNQFLCTDENIYYWKEKGTWRIPPIILDVESLIKFPKWSELIPPYHLIEGHTRLGYIHSLKRISDLNNGKIASKHSLYLMKGK